MNRQLVGALIMTELETPRSENKEHIGYVALNLRRIVAEEIARNLRKSELQEESVQRALLEFGAETKYLPLDRPVETMLLTQSTLHCLLRCLACLVDLRLSKQKIDNMVLKDRMERVEQRREVPRILKPFGPSSMSTPTPGVSTGPSYSRSVMAASNHGPQASQPYAGWSTHKYLPSWTA